MEARKAAWAWALALRLAFLGAWLYLAFDFLSRGDPIGWLFIAAALYTVVRAVMLVNRWRASSTRR